ncbi:hypothetical protein [Deinococcus sp. QL22]|uniref:hypothetical protein n=1 Tax=Deinococcus sp. QL22 TaxID=2939437 RepID=UPI00201752C3|nr:hypothetical protein [Deinococcus sp. QL22]UQN06535.1 hypothetical protein M1R55_01035 [Deinococcus sp. QL22]
MLPPSAQSRLPSDLDALLARAGCAIDRQRNVAYEQEAPDLMYDDLSGEVVALPPPALPPVPTAVSTLDALYQQAWSRAEADLRRTANAGQRIPKNVIDIQAAMELDLALVTGRSVGEARGATFSTQGLIAASLGILRRTLCRALNGLKKISVPLRRALSRAHAQKVSSGRMRGQAAYDGCTTDLRPTSPGAHLENLHSADLEARWRAWRPHFGRDIDERASAGTALLNLLECLSVPLGFAKGSPAWCAVGTLCRVLFSLCPSAFFAFVKGELSRLTTSPLQDMASAPATPGEPGQEKGHGPLPATVPDATPPAVTTSLPRVGSPVPPAEPLPSPQDDGVDKDDRAEQRWLAAKDTECLNKGAERRRRDASEGAAPTSSSDHQTGHFSGWASDARPQAADVRGIKSPRP